MEYTISNGILTVTAETFGAQLCSVKQGGKEWLWQNPSGNWKEHAPLLFPWCGYCRCTHEGVEYYGLNHGFAKRFEFALTDKGEDFLRFTLKSNEETKKQYPFTFAYHMIYRIDGARLVIEHVVENEGEKPMYFAAGGHESFNLETNVEDYAIEFEKEEKFLHRYHGDKGGVLDQWEDFGGGKFFPLPAKFMQEGRTVIFENIKSRKLWLCEKGGRRLAEITFAEEFKNLLLWRADNDPYICIEPWSNLPDPEFAADIEFSKKSGVYKVEAGESKKLVRTVEYS